MLPVLAASRADLDGLTAGGGGLDADLQGAAANCSGLDGLAANSGGLGADLAGLTATVASLLAGGTPGSGGSLVSTTGILPFGVAGVPYFPSPYAPFSGTAFF
jgi:hypothetical protein